MLLEGFGAGWVDAEGFKRVFGTSVVGRGGLVGAVGFALGGTLRFFFFFFFLCTFYA